MGPETVSNPDKQRSRRYPAKRGAKGLHPVVAAPAGDVSNPDILGSAAGSRDVRNAYRKEIAKTIAKKVYQQRKLRYPFHTQEDMAQVLGTSRATVVAIENGTRKLTAVELVLLADWWQIDVRELLP